MKIIKNVDKYREAAKLEVNVLEKLQEKATVLTQEMKRRGKTVHEEFEQVHPHKSNRCANGKIQVREWVAHSSHPCLHSASVLGTEEALRRVPSACL